MNDEWKNWRPIQRLSTTLFCETYQIKRDEKYAIMYKIMLYKDEEKINYLNSKLGITTSEVDFYYQKVVYDLSEKIKKINNIDSYQNLVNYDFLIVRKKEINGYDIYIKHEDFMSLSDYIEKYGLSKSQTIRLGIETIDAIEILNKNGIDVELSFDDVYVGMDRQFKLGKFHLIDSLKMIMNIPTEKNNLGEVTSTGILLYEALKQNTHSFSDDDLISIIRKSVDPKISKNFTLLKFKDELENILEIEEEDIEILTEDEPVLLEENIFENYISEDTYKSYIDINTDYYMNEFKKIDDDSDKGKFHIMAFFLPEFWYSYRYMFSYAAISLILHIILFFESFLLIKRATFAVNLQTTNFTKIILVLLFIQIFITFLWHVISGMTANEKYYNSLKKRILKNSRKKGTFIMGVVVSWSILIVVTFIFSFTSLKLSSKYRIYKINDKFNYTYNRIFENCNDVYKNLDGDYVVKIWKKGNERASFYRMILAQGKIGLSESFPYDAKEDDIKNANVEVMTDYIESDKTMNFSNLTNSNDIFKKSYQICKNDDYSYLGNDEYLITFYEKND